MNVGNGLTANPSNATHPSSSNPTPSTMSTGPLPFLAPSSNALTSMPASIELTAEERGWFRTRPLSTLRALAEERREMSEEKKEELRQLVGIRYRVLIETADSILSMQTLMKDAQHRYNGLEELIPRLERGIAAGESEDEQDDTDSVSSSTFDPNAPPSSLLSLLLMLRHLSLGIESLWSHLDSNRYDSALVLWYHLRRLEQRMRNMQRWPMLDAAAEADGQKSINQHPAMVEMIDALIGRENKNTTLTTADLATKTDAQPSTHPRLLPASLTSSLTAFLEHHSAYLAALTPIISNHARLRLRECMNLSTKEISECLVAIAMTMPTQTQTDSPSHGLGEQLLDTFLSFKTQQMQHVASCALTALKASSTMSTSATSFSPSSATAVIIHACQQLLLIIQYTVLDCAALFGSNDHGPTLSASAVTLTLPLTSSGRTPSGSSSSSFALNVASQLRQMCRRIGGVAALDAHNNPPSLSMPQPYQLQERNEIENEAAALSRSIHVDSMLLKKKVEAWLDNTSKFLSNALENQLLPFLLHSHIDTHAAAPAPASTPGSSSTASSNLRACVAFQQVRDAIIRTANWQDERSWKRDNNEPQRSETGHKQPQTRGEKQMNENEKKEEEKQLVSDVETRANQHVAETDPAVQRKRMQQQWEEACIALFGPRSNTPGTAVTNFSSTFSLFDSLFFPSLRSFTSRLVDRCFEQRTTFINWIKRIFQQFDATTDNNKDSDKAKEQAKQEPSTGSTRNNSTDHDTEDMLVGPSSGVRDQKAPSSKRAHAGAQRRRHRLELCGERESSVQEIVRIIRRQFAQLIRECRTIMTCSAGAGRLRPTTVTPSNQVEPPIPQTLQRYLNDELAPLFTRKYGQLIDGLVKQIKKQLRDLESFILSSLSDATSWASESTRKRVDQAVFLARVCSMLARSKDMELDAGKLTMAMTMNANNTPALPPSFSPSSSSSSSSSFHSSLHTVSRHAFRIGTRVLATRCSEEFLVAFNQWIDLQMKLQSQTHPDKQLPGSDETTNNGTASESIANMNESDGIKTYYEKIFSNACVTTPETPLGLFLPVHVSPFIAQLLFELHAQYYRLFGWKLWKSKSGRSGGAGVDGSVIEWMLQDVGVACMQMLEQALSIHDTTQHDAPSNSAASQQDAVLHRLSSYSLMQLLFDVLYLFGVLRLPAASITQRFKPSTLAAQIAAVSSITTSSSSGGGVGASISPSSTLTSPSSSPRARFLSLVSSIESVLECRVDPIDWYASRPTFLNNVQQAMMRSSMQYGLACKSNPLPHLLPSMPRNVPATTTGGTTAASTTTTTSAPIINMMPLAAPLPRILPLSASLYPPLKPTAAAASTLAHAAGIKATTASGLSTTLHPLGSRSFNSTLAGPAAASMPGTPSRSTMAATSPLPSPSGPGIASSNPLSAAGLSFSQLSSQLSFAQAQLQSSAHAKAIGEIGSSILGRLSANALWGGGGTSSAAGSGGSSGGSSGSSGSGGRR